MAAIFDTVAAISTPPGKGGVALIRMSGGEADAIAKRVFVTASGKSYSDIKPRVQTYGFITESGERVDDVLLTRFPAPNSYTGEDVVEICCHGGILVTRCVLEALLSAGARAAEAGEFTRRAFVSGKLSLTEAEAIGTLLDAGSRDQMRISSEPSRRRLTKRVGAIRQTLVQIMSSIYARIDYPDEDLGEYSDAELLGALESIRKELHSLASTYRTGRAVCEGISTVICGKPNAGKSSLYNLLLGEDAAIVTDVEGTTRDVLTNSIPLGKVMLRLCDTAGIRDFESADAIERIGIEKSRNLIAKCELLFALFDVSRPFDKNDEALISEIRKAECTKIALINKCDLPHVLEIKNLGSSFDKIIEISTTDEIDTVKELTHAVEGAFTDGSIRLGDDAIIWSARQHAALTSAKAHLDEAIKDLQLGFMQDAISGHVERAIGSIGELDGRQVGEEVVSDIFARFCVGK